MADVGIDGLAVIDDLELCEVQHHDDVVSIQHVGGEHRVAEVDRRLSPSFMSPSVNRVLVPQGPSRPIVAIRSRSHCPVAPSVVPPLHPIRRPMNRSGLRRRSPRARCRFQRSAKPCALSARLAHEWLGKSESASTLICSAASSDVYPIVVVILPPLRTHASSALASAAG